MCKLIGFSKKNKNRIYLNFQHIVSVEVFPDNIAHIRTSDGEYYEVPYSLIKEYFDGIKDED